MTQRELFTRVIEVMDMVEVADKDEIVTGLKARIEQLDKKNSSSKGKPSAKTLANAQVRDRIVEMLDKPMRVDEVAEMVGITHGSASALLTQLVKTERIKRVEIKRVPYFAPLDYTE